MIQMIPFIVHNEIHHRLSPYTFSEKNCYNTQSLNLSQGYL